MVLSTFAIIGLVLLPYREMPLDDLVLTRLFDDLQVIHRDVCEMLGVVFIFALGPFVTVVVVPMCEHVITTFMETLDESGY